MRDLVRGSGRTFPWSRWVPQPLAVVRFVVGDRELPVAWDLAVELRDRCIRADDPFAREVAARMRAVGATRPVTLTRDQFAALLAVLERWEVEAETGRLLRLAISDELGT
jgi:hypothetical protein